MDLRAHLPRLLGAVVIVALAGAVVPAALAQDTVDDLRDAREAARRDAAEAAAAIDALSAEDAELVEALAAIDDHIALQEAKVRTAVAAIAAAEDAAAAAVSRAGEIDEQIEAIRDRLRERAIEAYVSPAATAQTDLDTADLLEATLRRSFLDQIVGDEYELVDQLRTAIAEQEAAQAEAADALEVARAERTRLDERLTEREAARQEAERLRAEVQDRVAEWQTISDEIEAADQEIAEEIRRLEEEARRAAEEQARQEAEARRLAEEEARRLAEEEAAADADPDDTDPDTDPDAEPAPEDDDPQSDGGEDDPDGEEGDGGGEDDGDPAPVGTFAITHRPVNGPITSPFGERIHPIFGTVRNHYGIDFNGSTGDPIVAAADGVVLSSGWRTGYGNTVVVSHGDGFTTLYAHMTDMNVLAGDQVVGGELIGWVGSTGWSTGSHLHFEVRLDGVALDPALYL